MGRPSCCVPSAEIAAEPLAAAPARSFPHGSAATAAIVDWCAIPAGSFTMGTDGAEAVPGDHEGPARRVTLDAFSISACTITNAQFAAFVRATRHVTDAERLGSSYVFHLQLSADQRAATQACAVHGLPWWRQVEHACWQRPEGPGSHVHARPGQPVVHVSWNDAQAYCEWTSTCLPSEAEWERAARGGLEGRRFAWGDELLASDGKPRCNIFRGDFPDAAAPGWRPGPVDARSGEANGFGLFNSCGNVWEWCADPVGSNERALRGGSFLCHDSYCNRYRVSARSSNTGQSSASNMGFRVAKRVG